MGVPAGKIEPEPLVSARVKVRPKAQLTLPEEIRRALHISEGDEVEFAVHDDGTVTVRGYVSIPTDQAWFFTPQWLAGEREADEEIAAGQGTAHGSAEDMFAHLDALAPGADADFRDAAAFRERLEEPDAPAAECLPQGGQGRLRAGSDRRRTGRSGRACASKGVKAHPNVFERTWDNDGRATFSYGAERVSGQPPVIWRRIGTHDIFTPPPGP